MLLANIFRLAVLWIFVFKTPMNKLCANHKVPFFFKKNIILFFF